MKSTKNLVLNPGLNFRYRIAWRASLLIIVIVSVLLVILNQNYLSINMGVRQVEMWEPDDRFFLHTPSNKHYTLRLRPKPYKVPPFQKGDYKKLIDMNDFNFTIMHEEDCKNSDTFLLVLITSAPLNSERRHAIRTTWGQRNAKIKTFFMLGAVSDTKVQTDINKENDVYADIVQGNFVDSYRNLSYKSVMALKYVSYHCYNVTYVLKSDDDVFVNMPLLINYLMNDLSPFGAENLLQCHVMKNMPILRDSSAKWRVSEEEFPGKEYPTYCNGPYSLFSPDVVFKIYEGAQRSKYFFIEDVFLYGIAVGLYPEINHTDTRPFAIWGEHQSEILSSGTYDNVNFLFGPFGLNVKQLRDFWNFVTSRPVPSSIYYYDI